MSDVEEEVSLIIEPSIGDDRAGDGSESCGSDLELYPGESTRIPQSEKDTEDEEEKDKTSDDSERQYTPWLQVCTLYLVAAADGLSMTVLEPYYPLMLRTTFGFDEVYVGVLAGITQSSYSFASMISAPMIGSLSDRLGRRKFLVSGGIIMATTTLLFTLSPYFLLALLLRFCCGLLVSNKSVARACLADISKPHNRAVIFGYLGGVFASSRMLSAGIGGTLTLIPMPLALLLYQLEYLLQES